MKEILPLLGLLLMVVVVLVLAYFASRFVATRGIGQYTPGGVARRMKVIDQLMLGRDQKLVVAQVGGRHLLLGVTAAGMNLLVELTEEEAALWKKETTGGETPSFKEAFLSQLRERKKK